MKVSSSSCNYYSHKIVALAALQSRSHSGHSRSSHSKGWVGIPHHVPIMVGPITQQKVWKSSSPTPQQRLLLMSRTSHLQSNPQFFLHQLLLQPVQLSPNALLKLFPLLNMSNFNVLSHRAASMLTYIASSMLKSNIASLASLECLGIFTVGLLHK